MDLMDQVVMTYLTLFAVFFDINVYFLRVLIQLSPFYLVILLFNVFDGLIMSSARQRANYGQFSELLAWANVICCSRNHIIIIHRYQSYYYVEDESQTWKVQDRYLHLIALRNRFSRSRSITDQRLGNDSSERLSPNQNFQPGILSTTCSLTTYAQHQQERVVCEYTDVIHCDVQWRNWFVNRDAWRPHEGRTKTLGESWYSIFGSYGIWCFRIWMSVSIGIHSRYTQRYVDGLVKTHILPYLQQEGDELSSRIMPVLNRFAEAHINISTWSLRSPNFLPINPSPYSPDWPDLFQFKMLF